MNFYKKEKKTPKLSIVKKNRKVVSSKKTKKGHERTFWGDGNVPYLDRGMCNSGVYIHQNLSN